MNNKDILWNRYNKELEEIIDTINELAISNYKNKNMHTKMMRELVLSMHKKQDKIKQIEG